MANKRKFWLRQAGFAIVWAIGVIGWFAAFAAVGLPTDWAMPLGDASDIAVDSAGNVYVAMPFYSRVQIYGSNGDFKTAIAIASGGGDFRIHMDQSDQMYVYSARNDTCQIFDDNLQLISESKVKLDPQFWHIHSTMVSTPGYDYELRYRWIYPVVIRISHQDHAKNDAVRMPVYQWFLMAPFPAFAFAVIGMGGFCYPMFANLLKTNPGFPAQWDPFGRKRRIK